MYIYIYIYMLKRYVYSEHHIYCTITAKHNICTVQLYCFMQ